MTERAELHLTAPGIHAEPGGYALQRGPRGWTGARWCVDEDYAAGLGCREWRLLKEDREQ